MAKSSHNSKDVSLRSFEQGSSPADAAKQRLAHIAKQLNIKTNDLHNQQIDPDMIAGHNIENLVGETALPLGVAGPITIDGDYINGRHYIACATTEGTLVASMSRGAKALTTSGGVKTSVAYNGMSRAPLFVLPDTKHVADAKRQIHKLFKTLADAAATTSNHLTLTNIDTFGLGKYLWVRLSFDTQEAMGMNMVTIASEKVCEVITKEIMHCELVSLSGNMCVDKKANWMNVIAGRGYDVTAECVIPHDVLKSMFKATAGEIATVCRTKNWYGSAMSGSMSFNAHAANIVSALFLATGQDAAHIIESSQAFTVAEETDGGLYFAVKVPNITCGTVGGGTGLPAQKTAMTIALTNIDAPTDKIEHGSFQFAELVAAAVLAGELSLLAALCTNTLASAHIKHARGGNDKSGASA